ncbi:MAG: hypothetical protein ABFC77_16255, partial [Thermoguttaceae bacterium]
YVAAVSDRQFCHWRYTARAYEKFNNYWKTRSPWPHNVQKSNSDIAVKAAGQLSDPNQYKEVIAELKRLGYLDTKEGRGGGCWLTAAGQQRACKL